MSSGGNIVWKFAADVIMCCGQVMRTRNFLGKNLAFFTGIISVRSAAA
jgi:hypothetical protein